MTADLQAVVERLEGLLERGVHESDSGWYVGSYTPSGLWLIVDGLSHGMYPVAAEGPQAQLITEAINALPTLLAALRQPVEGALDREAVARIIDPDEYRRWQSMYDYGIKVGDSEEEARASADWAHKKGCDEALAKADAILALQSSNVRDTGRGG